MEINQLITSEAHLEKFIIKHWSKYFDSRLFCKRKKIGKRGVIDLASIDNKSNICIIELKYRPIRNSDNGQLKRYIRLAKEYFISVYKISGMFIGYNHKDQIIYSKKYGQKNG